MTNDRTDILTALRAYETPYEDERADVRDTIAFITAHEDAFARSCVPGHVTGSAVLISRDGTKILLNRHKKLGRWMHFGGHADGSADILDVARRELAEESGIETAEPVSRAVFDVDVHTIPANATKGEPEHKHYDIRYLFRCSDNDSFVCSDESTELRWCTAKEALTLVDSKDLRRMIGKWKEIFLTTKATKS
ncbi:MAG: NUDIX hydrolase [Alphaproteobacteria bacterium]|nr:NUDIX hydrolase [Alphaproteobacteria bacterium]